MKIEITQDEYCRGISRTITVTTDNGESNSVFIGEGEPEDMRFGRDLPAMVEIQQLIEMAYNAGKNGESIELPK